MVEVRMFHLLTVLITFLVLAGVTAQPCPSGWFGETCMYQCQCYGEQTCNNLTGKCPENKCIPNYFGPGCQYKDLVMLNSQPTTDSYIKDGNKTTCNPNVTATAITVNLTAPFQFMWFRIEVKVQINILNLSIQINNNDQCSSKLIYTGEGFVDVTCDTIVSIYMLQITGPIASNVCSIYICGGRNVALKQNANQSALSANFDYATADKAVDGNLSSNFSKRSCTYTQEEPKPWWKLIFNRPQILLSVDIINSNENPERLLGFNIKGFDDKGNLVFDYTDNKTVAPTVFTVDWNSRIPTMSLVITDASILSMCEVNTFGETVCPEGRFGLWCGETCQCNATQFCSTVNGLCAPGCASGFSGPDCTKPCNKHCLAGLCTPIDGRCLQCVPGYKGDFCKDVCPAGFYGNNCSSQCYGNCKNVCNHVTGNCTCMDNFVGPKCADCVAGKYGVNCTKECSKQCSSEGCKRTTGECFSCQERSSGKFCEECISVYYGPMCDFKCSNFCANGTCNDRTGHCPVCVDGYIGANCNTSELVAEFVSTNKVHTRFLVYLLIIAIATLVIALTLFLFLGTQSDVENEHEIGT